MRSTLALVACAAVAAGCGGDGGEVAAPATAGAAPAAPAGRTDPAPGRVLFRFVGAARAGAVATMRSLLTAETRRTIPPTGTRSLARSFAPLVGKPRLVLSRVLGRRWGVAAVAGERLVEGEREPFSYGAAVVRERGEWRIDLGGLVVDALEPEPLAQAAPDAEVGARASAADPLLVFAVWIDGAPVVLDAYERTTFTTRARGRPSRPLRAGRRDAVAFAATARAAFAVAWPFTVEP